MRVANLQKSCSDLSHCKSFEDRVPVDKIFSHDDVIEWKHLSNYWLFLRGIHWSQMNSLVTSEFPHKGQWCGALMSSLICPWTNCWVNNRDAGDLRCHCSTYPIFRKSSQYRQLTLTGKIWGDFCEFKLWSTSSICQHYPCRDHFIYAPSQ